MMESAMSATTFLSPARRPWPRLRLRGVVEAMIAADARYRDRENFLRLDEHLMRDIGLTRADLAAGISGRRR
jgi:uncharacterized protein YjiS (DUF1127 family)